MQLEPNCPLSRPSWENSLWGIWLSLPKSPCSWPMSDLRATPAPEQFVPETGTVKCRIVGSLTLGNGNQPGWSTGTTVMNRNSFHFSSGCINARLHWLQEDRGWRKLINDAILFCRWGRWTLFVDVQKTVQRLGLCSEHHPAVLRLFSQARVVCPLHLSAEPSWPTAEPVLLSHPSCRVTCPCWSHDCVVKGEH